MDTQSYFEHGGDLVRNPNYSSNNGQPKFINKTDVSKSNNPLASAFYKSGEEGYGYTVTDPELINKSKKYGVPLTRQNVESGTLDKQFYDAQSGLNMLFNSLEQTIVGEIGLGTLKGFSEIADMIGNAITDNDFFRESGLTKAIADLQEKNKQAFNINTLPNMHLGNGALTNAGWWASNFPSVASSFTLLIPAKAMTAAPSVISKTVKSLNKSEDVVNRAKRITAFTKKGKKALNALNKENYLGLGAIGREAIAAKKEIAANAAFMRTMENYQEAKQVSEDVFNSARAEFADKEKYAEYLRNNPEFVSDLQQQGIDISDSDEVARYIAKKAANKTFAIDYANIVFDVIQVAALHNPAKIGKNNPWISRKVAQADRRSRVSPLKPQNIVEAEEKALKLPKRTINYFKDVAGAIPTLAAEASEGVEEAINYIAQQWGMTYGNILLGKEEKDVSLADKLSEYMKNPEMWDAAIWGWFGGIGFEMFGSKYNQLTNAISERRKDKENGAELKSFGEYLKNSEDPYRIKDINNRVASMNLLIERNSILHSGKNGKNPFKPDGKGGYADITSDVEKRAVQEQINSEYIGTLTLSALQAGNYQSLKSYLQDENVRRVLKEQGIILGDDTDTYLDDMVTRMETIANKYETHLDRLDKLTEDINEKVPVEYLQMVARENTLAEMEIESLKLDSSVFENEISKLESTMSFSDGNAATAVDIYHNLRNKSKINILAYRLAEIQAKLKLINEDDEYKDSISGGIEIGKLNEQKKKILKEIRKTAGEQAAAASLWSILQAENAIIDDNNQVQVNMMTKDFAELASAIDRRDEKIIKQAFINNGLKDFASKLDINAFVNDAKQGEYNLFIDNLEKLEKYRENNPAFAKQYQIAEYIKLLQLDKQSDIVTNKTQLLKRLNAINDSLADIYTSAQKQARRNILNIAKKLENGEQKIYNYIFNGAKIEGLSEQDKILLDESIDIMAFKKDNETFNKRFAEDLGRQGYERKMNVEKKKVSSSASENPSESNESLTEEDSPQTDHESNTDRQNGIEGENTDKDTTPKLPKAKITINADDNNKIIVESVADDSTGTNVVELEPLEENNYKIIIANDANNVNELLQSSTLFVGFDRTKENNDKYEREITRSPYINIGKDENTGDDIYKVVNTGKIVYKEKQPEAKASIPFTGDLDGADIPKDALADVNVPLTSTPLGKEMFDARQDIMRAKSKFWLESKTPIQQICDELNQQLEEIYGDGDRETLDAVKQDTPKVVISGLFGENEIKDEEIQNLKEGVENVVKHSIIDETIKLEEDVLNSIHKIIPYYLNKHKSSSFNIEGKTKYYINLNQLLDDINELYGNSDISAIVHDFLVSYLNTNEGKQRYAITYLDPNSPDFLEKINAKDETRSANNLNTIQEADINKFGKQGRNELNKLIPGSKIDVEISQYENYDKIDDYLSLKYNGIEIGGLALANYIDGKYSKYTQGWNYILSEDNGYINCNLLNVFIDLLNDKHVYNTLLEIRSENTSEEDKIRLKRNLNKYIANFKYNGERLGKKYVFEGTKENKSNRGQQPVEHLILLTTYDEALAKASYEEAKHLLQDTIYKFIQKMYYTYDAAKSVKDKLNRGEKVSITVDEIPGGKLLQPVEFVTKDTYSQLNQSNIAVANTDKVFLGIKESNENGNSGLTVLNDGQEIFINHLYTGSIVLSFKDKNDKFWHTRAVSVKFNDEHLDKNSKAYECIQFIQDEFGRRIDDWNKNNDNFVSFVDYCRKLFSKNYKGKDSTNESLLRNVQFRYTNSTIRLGDENNILIEISRNRIKVSGKNAIETIYNKKDITGNDFKKIIKPLLDKSIFNISYTILKEFSNKNKSSLTSGFIDRKVVTDNDPTAIQLKINSVDKNIEPFVYTAKDYKSLLIEGGFLRTNTKKYSYKDKKGKTITKEDNFDYSESSKFKIIVPNFNKENNSSPVKEEITKNDRDISKIEQIIREGKYNPIRKAFEMTNLTRITHEGKKVSVLKMLKDFDLLADNINLDETLNSIDDNGNYVGPIAEVNDNQISIGQRWLDMFNEEGGYSKQGYRIIALKKLIHENLHLKLNKDGNQQYVKRITDIFNEFKDYVNNNDPDNKHIKQFFFETRFVKNEEGKYVEEKTPIDIALEEFLVESITNSDLAEYLNNIRTESTEGFSRNDIKKEDRNLFQKIIDFIIDLFNFGRKAEDKLNIQDNTLYAKEFVYLAKEFTEAQGDIQVSEQETQQQKVEQKPVNKFDRWRNVRDIKQSSVDEVSSINQFVNTAKPYNKQDLLKRINSGELSIICS